MWLARTSVSQVKTYFGQACDLPGQVFHKSKSILGKHVTCLNKCFIRQRLFWASMWCDWSSVSQDKNYFGQACQLPEQVFHKSKTILGKHVTCPDKCFTNQKLFWASMWLAWSSVSPIEKYFEQAYDLPDQVFHKTKTILGKHVTCLRKCFTNRKLFWVSIKLAWASFS